MATQANGRRRVVFANVAIDRDTLFAHGIVGSHAGHPRNRGDDCSRGAVWAGDGFELDVDFNRMKIGSSTAWFALLFFWHCHYRCWLPSVSVAECKKGEIVACTMCHFTTAAVCTYCEEGIVLVPVKKTAFARVVGALK
jgi:hypothetical protein